MTEVLLDTHAFLWGLRDAPDLSPTARDLLQRPDRIKVLSLASAWEMAIKAGLGKLRLTSPLGQMLDIARQTGLRLAPIELIYILRVETLPWHHRDPFDRLLVAHCLVESMPILSNDPLFDTYGIKRLW